MEYFSLSFFRKVVINVFLVLNYFGVKSQTELQHTAGAGVFQLQHYKHCNNNHLLAGENNKMISSLATGRYSGIMKRPDTQFPLQHS